MPTSPTAGVPWSFYEPPVYIWNWNAALPAVPVPPPGTGGGGGGNPPPGSPPPGGNPPPVPPGAPSGVPTLVPQATVIGLIGSELGIELTGPIFIQTGRSPVFLRPKPVYRPVANLCDWQLRMERWRNKHIVPLGECNAKWLEPCLADLPDNYGWGYVPPDMVVFNPVKGIPLPAMGSGDVEIFRMQVPDGYHGVIIAHFHSVQLPTGSEFLEGTGDLAWRLSVDGRFLRDMGNMIETQGQPQFYDPIAGGFLIHTHGVVIYSVSNFNVTGTLPTTGNVVAGIHGWFYPMG